MASEPLTLREGVHIQAALKRGLDIAGALLGLLLFSPVLLVAAIALRFSSPGGVLFRQTRVGKDGCPFTLLKFRTMRTGGEEELDAQLDNDPRLRLEFSRYQKLARDPRLTPFGGFLRRTSLDELPQLWNVLVGEMSLVGPRPFLPEQAYLYGPGLDLYTHVRPGLTGLWQVSGRNLLSFEERAALDREYLCTWSLRLDLSILLRTPWVVITRLGAY